MNKQNRSAIEYLSALEAEEFWGALTVKFEAGRVVHIRREENIKPEQLSNRMRLINEQDRG